jgi:hypothetical protein
MYALYYRQQCGAIAFTGRTSRSLERLLELRKLALDAIEKSQYNEGSEYEKIRANALQDVMTDLTTSFLKLSLSGRSITTDPKIYVFVADDAIRQWQDLPPVKGGFLADPRLEAFYRLSRARQEVSVLVSIALACHIMTAEEHQRAYVPPDAILWKKSVVCGVGQDCRNAANHQESEPCPVCQAAEIPIVGDAERRAIRAILDPKATDLLRCALRLCETSLNTDEALISRIANYLKKSEAC